MTFDALPGKVGLAAMPPLRFSILTPTLNRRAWLPEALDSVAAQDWPAVEHLVADGGSTDGTHELLAARGDAVRLLEGVDSGIYDGLNKLVAAARGDVVGWLNSDDLYGKRALATAAALFAQDNSLDAVCGAARIEANGVVERWYPAPLVRALNAGALLIGPTLPNAWFFRRRVFERVGSFSTTLPFAADSDFMMRFARTQPKVRAADALFYRYRRHADSATIGTGATRAVREDMLRLALGWRNDPDPQTRVVARALEGRCRAALALGALRRGDVTECARALAFAPIIAEGLWDFAWRWTLPALRGRRAGLPPPASVE